MNRLPIFCLAASVMAALPSYAARLPVFGEVKVVDQIDCTKDDHRFEDYPSGASRVEDILGKPCRVLPVQESHCSYLSWRIGEGKGLKPNGAYVVVIEYPDDKPRSYHIRNYGNDSRRSFYTGTATGDAYEGPIVGHKPESLKIPQSGKYELWTALTFLGEKSSNFRDLGKDKAEKEGVKLKLDIATDGFHIAISQYKKHWHPGSEGVAVSRILLCEIPDEKAAWAKINYPPSPLPRRHIFWREEMSDGAIGKESNCPGNDGIDWFEQKCRAMKILGQNTFCKDLLEFGHNQHWDCEWRHGQPDGKPWSWMWTSHAPFDTLWTRLVPVVVDKYGFDILPYYEYGGAAGNPEHALGPQKRAEPLDIDNKDKSRGVNYTHIWWSEGKLRVDITDPDTLDELKYILDGTILRFEDQVRKGGFLGAWFRPRPGQWAVSFSDATRARFAKEANGGKAVSRADLKGDNALYERYLDWWGAKRAAFIEDIRKYLEQNGVRNAEVILDNDASEAGEALADADGMVTDDPAGWTERLPGKKFTDINDARVLSQHLYLKALKTPASTWGAWEWQHACPASDPEHYQGLKNAWIAMPFHALFTVTDPDCFTAFRNGNGTSTLVRHYDLNEGTFEDGVLGYAMADWERAGRACMIAEVNAMANGDPVNIGYLIGSNYTRGFPGPVQEFNLNFLALPALPSKVVPGAAQAEDVVVREINGGSAGRYYAVVHTGFSPKKGVKVRFPNATIAQLPATGKPLTLKYGTAVLDLEPWQLLAVRVK